MDGGYLQKALLEAFPSEKEKLTRYYAEVDRVEI
jgi:hypothetical protein